MNEFFASSFPDYTTCPPDLIHLFSQIKTYEIDEEYKC
jgi:hypothetical protein